VNAKFLKRHLRCGKARMRWTPRFPEAVWFGAPSSEHFLRGYEKPRVGFRVEIQFNRPAIKKYGLEDLNEWRNLPEVVSSHLQFVRVDWPRLRRYLDRRPRTSQTIFRRARVLHGNLDELMRFLQQVLVSNPTRFLVPMPLNARISAALRRLRRQWEQDGQNQ
jgi:hypothetical protein